MANIDTIRGNANLVKNSTEIGENTAERVGGVLTDLVDKLEEHETNTGIDEYPMFSAATAYSAGDVVNYNGKLYKFTADHAAGAWTGTDAEVTDVVNAHIVQDTGDAEDKVMSQKAVSDKLSDLFINLDNKTLNLSIEINGKYAVELLNGYMDSDGTINGADNESYKHTDYIKVDISRIYLYTGSYGYGTNCPAVLFFDKDKHIIDSIIAEGQNRVSDLEIDFNSEVRKNTVYVVFNSESQTTYPLSIIIKAIRGLIEEIQDTKNSIFNPYSEIVYGAIGDSITNGYFADLITDDEAELKPSNTYPRDPRKNYAYNIKKYFKIKKYYNYGRDGRSIGRDYGFADTAHSNSTDLVTYDKLADDLTHISIWFGWNDANASIKTPIGEINDNTHTTWCGAWNIVLRELIKKYPHAKILVILPYGVEETYVNAEKEIAEKWGVAYMSVGEVSGEMSFFDINSDKEIDGVNIRTFRRKLFTPDNTHPNTEGYKYLYTRIANKLFSISY